MIGVKINRQPYYFQEEKPPYIANQSKEKPLDMRELQAVCKLAKLEADR